jgi:hypothetical protein
VSLYVKLSASSMVRPLHHALPAQVRASEGREGGRKGGVN